MTGTDPKHAYLQATRRLMQQLAAGGLRLGLSHGQLEAGLRDAMLEAAYLQSRRSGGRVTVSSLHVATGIHRREISRWLNERKEAATAAAAGAAVAGQPLEPVPAGDAEAGEAGAGDGGAGEAASTSGDSASAQTLGNDSPSARVVARWTTNAGYTDAQGEPLALPMQKRAYGPSFAQLVEDIGPEVRARSVLDGLIAAGLVEAQADGRFSLSAVAYLPEANSRESIGFLAANVGDHLAAAIHNISAPADARFFERAFFDDDVSAETVRALQETVRTEGMNLLRGLVTTSDSVERAQREAGDGGGQRVRIGLYCFTERGDADEGT
ncbi:MAG: DUF6502 family protein [Pseudomonadota bacterium]|nr:DUF6502 family protein [Pseudomonadota bacterium]